MAQPAADPTEVPTEPTQAPPPPPPGPTPEEQQQQYQRDVEARSRYAQMVDLIRGGGTPAELTQACDLLRPIAQAVQQRM